jgi:4,5-DOPA dioxygenase extradiol
MPRLPTLFLSHGSPMNAVEPGVAGLGWKELGRSLPRPRSILIASAHWETSEPMLTGNLKPDTIHDFGGFPAELYQLRYPAPGAPELAARAVALLKDAGIEAGIDARRGLDHGAWVPLRYIYPDADIPVVQLSLQPELGAAHHYRLGQALSPLADEGVLVIGSGHTTHNLRDWMAQRGQPEPLAYARKFAGWVGERLAANDVPLLLYWRDKAPDAQRAHPSEEHFLPLFIALGAAGSEPKAELIIEGFEGPALSLDSYLFRPRTERAVQAV